MRRPDEWGKLQMFPTSFSFHTICLTINAEAGEVVGEVVINMDLKSAKISIENEVSENFTDIQKPFANKYASWKIIDYICAAHEAGEKDFSIKEWLINLYITNGMTNENIKAFGSDIDIILLTIERCLSKNYGK